VPHRRHLLQELLRRRPLLLEQGLQIIQLPLHTVNRLISVLKQHDNLM
jgi:hypothetical protein